MLQAATITDNRDRARRQGGLDPYSSCVKERFAVEQQEFAQQVADIDCLLVDSAFRGDWIGRRVARPELPAYEQAAFDKNLPAWTKLVADGKKTPSDLLAMLSTKATFSDAQRQQILSLERAAEAPAADSFVAELEAAERAEQ